MIQPTHKIQMLSFEPTNTSYCIPITVEQFLAMDNQDTLNVDNDDLELSEILDKLDGVWNTDYNGHFGPNIFLTIEADCDTIELKSKIANIILSHIAGS
jgi:hypothetical protein